MATIHSHSILIHAGPLKRGADRWQRQLSRYLVQSFVDLLERVRRLFSFRRDDDADVDDDELVAGRQLGGASVRQVGGGVVGVVHVGVMPVRSDLDDLQKNVRKPSGTWTKS